MAHPQNSGDLRSLLEFFSRRRWVITGVFLPLALGAVLAALLTPNEYQSTISVYMEPQKVPQEYVRSTVTNDIEGRLRTVVQQLTGPTRLLRVLEEIDLYPEEARKGVPREILIGKMASKLLVEVPNRREDNFFRVSFRHQDPRKARAAVSRLVDLFIADSLEVREAQAAGTTEFITEELQGMKAALEKQEAALKAFRQGAMGELPQQLEANLRMLDNLNTQLTGTLESERTAQDQVTLLEQEVGRLADAGAGMSASPAGGGDGPALLPLLQRREALRAEIAGLQSRYTPRHPDLVAAQRALDRLEATIAQEVSRTSGEAKSPAPGPSASATPTERGRLTRQLNEARLRLSALKDEEKAIREKIALYQRRVEAAPRREQELAALTRDYENSKGNYQDLLNKKLDAQLSENLERRQKGERFRVLDPANLPETPASPKRARSIALGIAFALAAGVGAGFLLETLFPAFHTTRRLAAVGGFPLVVGIPRIVTPKSRRDKARRLAIAGSAAVLALGLALAAVDRFVTPLPEVAQTIRENLKGARR